MALAGRSPLDEVHERGVEVGWMFGAAAIGLLIGAVFGIPLGVLVVYQVYGRTRT